MIVKRKITKWNKKAIFVFALSTLAYYLSIAILILLTSVSSPETIAILVLASFLLFLFFLFAPIKIFESVEVFDNVRVSKVFEINTIREQSYGGASVTNPKFKEKIIITDKGIVQHDYLIEWSEIKGCEVLPKRIILRTKFGRPDIVLPYNERSVIFYHIPCELFKE